MRRQHLSQRALSLLLALMMVLTCAPTALAESTEAAMMRLMKTEGAVSVTNSKGRSVATRADMRLHSGYGLETEEASYAWINLDDAKLVKMDAVTEISIRKSGKKLDILVDSGSLFFNVSKPLEEDETLNIRTSTMAVGVRGTCGWVKVIDQWTSQLYVLEGTVTVTVTDPVTGETKTETVKGGETVTCKVYPQDTSGSKCDIIRQGFTVSGIDGFVMVELVQDRPLCEKIKEDSGLDILGSGVNAPQKLKEDQEAVHDKLEEINSSLAAQENNISKDPVWPSPVPDGTAPSDPTGDGGTGGGSESTPTASSENAALTMPQTDDTVNAYLGRSNISGVTLLPGAARASTVDMLEVDSGITVPAGKTLTLRTGVRMEVLEGQTVALGANAQVTIGGAFISAGNLTGASGATVKATGIESSVPLEDWKQSAATDSAGYYTLTYSPKGVYTVTFDANGGSVSPTQMQTGRDSRLTSLPAPTWAGHDFDGWFTAAEGGEQITTVTVFTGDTTIYAHWTATEGPGWRYDRASKTLYILDDRAMVDYASDNDLPWIPFREEMQTVVVNSGVTRIGGRAFYAFRNLTGVTLPNGVTSIGDNAFLGCQSLTTLSLPDSVTSIGDSAFSVCRALTTLNLPNGLTSIGNSAIQGTSITTLSVPGSLTDVGRSAFMTGNWITLNYHGTETQWNAIPNITSSYLSIRTVINFLGEDVPSYTITYDANGGTGSGTTSALIQVSPTLTTVKWDEIPEPTREGYTFAGWYTEPTGGTLLTTSYNVTQSMTIYAHWTPGTSHTITFNANGGSVSPATAMTGANGRLSSLPMPVRDGYTFLGWYTAAANGAEVTTGTWFSTDTTIYAYWTEDSTSGVTWRYDEATRTLYIEGNGPMESVEGYTGSSTSWPWYGNRSSITSVVIGGGITSIGDGAFFSCSSLTSVTIPNSVTSIGMDAFFYCSSLTSVTVPDNVTSISGGAFVGCSGLTNVTIPDGITAINVQTFSGCSSLTSVTIPNSVASIGPNAFYSCDSLTNIYYTGTRAQWNALLPNIGTDNDPLLNATLHCTDDSTDEIGGETGANVRWSYDPATKTLTISGAGPMTDYSSVEDVRWAEYRAEIENLVIDNGVTSIGSYAFALCTGLTAAIIPDSVTSIGNLAFSGCSGLTSVTIPANITSIGYATFSGCSNLTVYYGGTEAQWNAIPDLPGASLDYATIHYNSTGRSIVSYSAPAYTDVPAGASYAEAVRYCADNNLMTGTSDTEFTPDGTLTRAMMVTVLHRLAGKPFAYATGSFADVEQGKWYTEAVSWASGKGIVNGYNPTTFGTNDPVTHEQVGLILQRYSGDQTIQVTGAESPKTPATRAEVAMTLMNYAKNRKPGSLSEASAIDTMCAPSGIALDKDGNLMVTDVYGKQLWRVQNRNGTAYAGGATVLDLYGQPMGGYNDASLQNSYFKEPWAIAPFLDGWAVSDTANDVVRLVSGSIVQTLNGATHESLKVTDLGVAFNGPTGLASDGNGNLYVSDTLSGAVRRVTPQGGVMTVAKGLSDPTGLCWKDGALYIAETGRNRVVKLEKGKVTTVAGSGEEALTDGSAAEAAFSSPKGVAVGDDGSVYVADTGNGAVRMVKGGVVTTLAVRDPEQLGGGLMSPTGLLARGNSLYICDTFTRKIFVYQLG